MAHQNQTDLTLYLDTFGRLIERGRTILDAGCGDGLPVDAYLVQQGFAVNGIDASRGMIELARKNVPQAFYEVKDLFDLKEGEYCVDGVVSLSALLHVPRQKYRALLAYFASFMSNGGALLLAMTLNVSGTAGEDGAGNNAELVEDAGFDVILDEVGGRGEKKHQIILARS